MPVIILSANRSLNIFSNPAYSNLKNGSILVGKDAITDYISYLNFDTTQLPSNISILSSKLVLFKTIILPPDETVEFMIYPLLQHFSSLSTYETRPEILIPKEVKYNPLNTAVDVEIDITEIVKGWYQGDLENKGLTLIGNNKNLVVCSFGSIDGSDKSLRPFIRVVYETNTLSFKLNGANININNKFVSSSPSSTISSTYVIETPRNTEAT